MQTKDNLKKKKVNLWLVANNIGKQYMTTKIRCRVSAYRQFAYAMQPHHNCINNYMNKEQLNFSLTYKFF